MLNTRNYYPKKLSLANTHLLKEARHKEQILRHWWGKSLILGLVFVLKLKMGIVRVTAPMTLLKTCPLAPVCMHINRSKIMT